MIGPPELIEANRLSSTKNQLIEVLYLTIYKIRGGPRFDASCVWQPCFVDLNLPPFR